MHTTASHRRRGVSAHLDELQCMMYLVGVVNGHIVNDEEGVLGEMVLRSRRKSQQSSVVVPCFPFS
jgi:hypothetical protein